MAYDTYEKIPDMLDFPKNEEKVISYWNTIDAFQTSLKQSEGKPRYAFYDGPPFATGLPHYGHILAGTIKDTITRFAHQSGFHVDRNFGWDCHGLPVEHEIDKIFGIKSTEDVEKLGIANYNMECRKIVDRYSSEWRSIITRLGRWIDFDNDYKTMYPTFMESVWWAFKELYKKNLVYHGYRVMPYSTRCGTPLSNFEANQNYKDVVDPSVVLSFPLTDAPDTSFLAWTTTPWTLISNLALIVNPGLTYVKLQVKTTLLRYILLESRIAEYFNIDDVVIEERFKGEAIKGKTYVPLFEYFSDWREQGAFQVFTDDYITEEEGTGIVQSAPAFGEDDYRVSLNNGLYRDGKTVPCPIDDQGCFTSVIQEYSGMYFKDTDKPILKRIKDMNRLFSNKTISHSYPFCWRSDTPLMYKIVPSWFVAVTAIIPQLMENNSQTYWVPAFVKEKRFTNWLSNARDWNISRNRFWGTPIPLWVNDNLSEVVCVGSIEELYELSGVKVSDIHRDYVDAIQIPSKSTPGTYLKRITEVFDCWFESGSMPYAQMHYPFENKDKFEKSFPANFVAEGIDQTRGWFYTLMVMSTGVFNKPAFRNLIASGLVLAGDGQKMSKRKKNYPDPSEVINKYGADALRLYLIDSPVVRAENLRFKEAGVRDMIKDVFLPWFNSFRYLTQNIDLWNKETNVSFVYDEAKLKKVTNVTDKWILSYSQSLINFIHQEIKLYRLYTVVSKITQFLDNLTNWYIRFNRSRLKGSNGLEDQEIALNTLFCVLYKMDIMFAPFIPFLTEFIYQHLCKYLSTESLSQEQKLMMKSVHFQMLPCVKDDFVDVAIEEAMSNMQTVVNLARVVRDRNTLPLKLPLKEIVVLHKDKIFFEKLASLEKYITDELNIKMLKFSTDFEEYGLNSTVAVDYKYLGKRLKADVKVVADALKNMTISELDSIKTRNGSYIVKGHEVFPDEITVSYLSRSSEKYSANSDGSVVVLLDVTQDDELKDESMAREIVNRIQKLRKKAGVVPTDEITVQCWGKDGSVDILRKNTEFLQTSVRQKVLIQESVKELKLLAKSEESIASHTFEFSVYIK